MISHARKVAESHEDATKHLRRHAFFGARKEFLMIFSYTPRKTNMEPENGPLEKEIPIGNHHFQVPYFWGCMSMKIYPPGN